MSALTVITDNKKAWGFATAHCPVLWQEVKDIRDLLTPVLLGEISVLETANILVREIAKPTLYYRVQEDDEFIYLLYMVYHPFDWSDSKIPLVAKLDSHRHDTETISIRVAKRAGLFRKVGRRDIGCFAHNSIFFRKDATLDFYIEPKGHGIHPLTDQALIDNRNILRYGKLKLIGFGEIPESELLGMKADINRCGVNFPDQHIDMHLHLQFRKPPENHVPGDLWDRPDMVFHLAERCGRL